MSRTTKNSRGERKGREYYRQKLLVYQKRVSNILESFTDGFFEVDSKWTVTYWNAEAERLLGMPRTEILGKNLWKVYEEAIPLRFFEEYQRAVENNIAVRFEEYFPTTAIWFEVAAFPSGDGLSVYFKDITFRKNAVQQLEIERKKYRDLFNRSPIPQWVYEMHTLRFLDVNEAAVNHYGYSREEFMELDLTDIRPSEELPVLDDILRYHVFPGTPNHANVIHKKKNGEVIHVYLEGSSVDFEGRDARMVMIIDRTAELKNKLVIEESMARFEIVSKATSDAIWDWDIESGKISWNQGIMGIFGYNQTNFDGKWRMDRIHSDDLDRVDQRFRTVIGAGQTEFKIEYRFLCADGSYRSVLDRAFILYGANNRALRMIGSMQDISERMGYLNKIETQNARLREISWIQAHQVRAPLSSILGLVQLVEDGDFNVQENKEIISRIRTASEDLDSVLKKIIART